MSTWAFSSPVVSVSLQQPGVGRSRIEANDGAPSWPSYEIAENDSRKVPGPSRLRPSITSSPSSRPRASGARNAHSTFAL